MNDEIDILQRDCRNFKLCPMTEQEQKDFAAMCCINKNLIGPHQPERSKREDLLKEGHEQKN